MHDQRRVPRSALLAFAVCDLGHLIRSSPELSPELSISTKARIQPVLVGNLHTAEGQPATSLLHPCRSCPGANQSQLLVVVEMHLFVQASQTSLDQTYG